MHLIVRLRIILFLTTLQTFYRLAYVETFRPNKIRMRTLHVLTTVIF